MTNNNGTFFTSFGCMDGRVQRVIADYGKEQFGADFPDTITEAGLDGLVESCSEKDALYSSLLSKLMISVEKHNSRGIIVHGHQQCAGFPVSDEEHKEAIKRDIETVKNMLGDRNIPVKGVFVKISDTITAEEVIL